MSGVVNVRGGECRGGECRTIHLNLTILSCFVSMCRFNWPFESTKVQPSSLQTLSVLLLCFESTSGLI